ncbi:two-component hybrid sensor and response regulator histidine kinase (Ntr family) [Desulforapulum autotrophicum HRM2]|uniref:histidine kinase n=1 Tax=Desulforapulum autotrophicum (strain ATCC 43914 / DSM 3382 / VKM B-1955 / HRM2) TaxID=177437 RepID=C0QLC4_DESAH|nr:ATP-binding protein [Desulforapulum autotrophicum]ACN14210.1 two-component hybrid sensor and response regulator histidine kinase (Ntr family) [Desulforapulum autotrophicum HRM2]
MTFETNIKERRPFRLVKYFTFTSLVVMFAATIIISAINTHWVRTILQQKSEEYAQLLVENLNHQVFLQFIIPVVLKYGQIKLREEVQYKRMDQVVKTTLHSFNVEMVNLYDMNNIISYSFDTSRIGTKNAGGSGYDNAVKNISSSRLLQHGSPLELFFGVPAETKIVTFAPLKAEKPLSSISGPILGVVEIVQDISKDYKKIFRMQILVTITCCIVMGSLFIVLIFVVRQGENIIDRRNQEQLKLEEKLRRAEHLSAIGEMTAGVSHEIRNPLGIIKSSAELLKKKMEKLGTSTTIVDIIVEESLRLNNIIKDFLDYARPRNPDLHPCRIKEVLEKNIAAIEPLIQEKCLEIETRFNDNIPKIMADAPMLYQAFLNVLLNAIQAMDDGGRIIISVFADNSNIIILFEDEGKGISEEALKKIWNPFFTTKDMGTGLGLGIVKNIIESHDGEIDISNRASMGVQVEIVIPAKESS